MVGMRRCRDGNRSWLLSAAAVGRVPGIEMRAGIHIVGMGLAGCCLAWESHFRGLAFTWCDDARRPGSASRVAAGLINPVTGKNFNPSWRLAEFLPEAECFYRRVGGLLGRCFWFPMPVWRLVGEKEWPKLSGKLENAEPWLEGIDESVPGWRAALVLRGGGRVAAREFCEATREFFAAEQVAPGGSMEREILCEGAAGLIAGRPGPHRCAKGEILTLRAPNWRSDRIVVGAGGWLVPMGGGTFRAGSTYVWDRLDDLPTAEGRERVEEMVRRLGGVDFEVIGHEAGVRPILRKSQPVVGALSDGRVLFNGLGSKGSLYAPGVAARLVDWLTDGVPLDPGLDLAHLSA
ncbi:MAG: FAD-dependent oxidoreductase [Verrucomicrobia bacterium]|nr:MAG: FAD-dependent oxidoreductase [Verrucomicrobiota bacterium]TAE87172.1 MAG: FAD-dependent oxidoreductase [Verrucomicrobiota bacterium]TAF24976.1 MAG: FAD-dependent oxidoreductase [Verrucomicrobiota bacterium]TAF40697.1 MAG: FAD-dependent oxidoreductase [Verrucomicrobiota bacterium]